MITKKYAKVIAKDFRELVKQINKLIKELEK